MKISSKEYKEIIKKPKRNKMGAIKTKCRLNHLHDSKGEAEYCNQLQLLKKAKEIVDFDIQKRFDMWVNESLICFHKVDFVIYKFDYKNNENIMEVHEFKGHETKVWKIKHKLFLALFPDIEYKIIKKGK